MAWCLVALDLHGATVDDDEMLTIWVDGADALFARLRAGRATRSSRNGTGGSSSSSIRAAHGSRVAEAPAPTTAELEVRLDTDEFEFDERSEWYVRLGFVEGEERESDEGAERILEAGPLQIVLHETNQSSALVTELD